MRSKVLLIFVLCCCVAGFSASARRVTYLHHALEAMREQLNEADVTLINDTLRVLFPRHLMFDANRAGVRADFIPTLERLSHVLQQYPKTDILLVGHTDSRGKENLNLELSRRRADSTRAALLEMGVKSSRLSSWGIGSSLPTANNKTESGRARNRRVEFIVLYNYKNEAEAR